MLFSPNYIRTLYHIAGKFREVKISHFHDLAQFAEVYSRNPYSQKYTIHIIVPLFKCLGSIMALLKYISVKSKSLPDPNRPLSSTVKPQSIESANQKVSALLVSECSSKHGSSG